jgi:DNA polymerase III sliding clamp (beta) subunit (PCNA family)
MSSIAIADPATGKLVEGTVVLDPPDVIPEKPPFEFAVAVRTARDVLKALKPALVHSTLPILGHVVIAQEGRLTRFFATDLDRMLSCNLAVHESVPVSELGRKLLEARHARQNGAIAVEHSSMTNLLKSMDPEGEIRFRRNATGFYSMSYPILGRPVDDARCVGEDPETFPPLHPFIPSVPSHTLSRELQSAVVEALPFASTDETRFILNGVYFDTEQQAVCATDGKALYVRSTALPFAESFVLPNDSVKTLAGLWTRKESDLTEISVNQIGEKENETPTYEARFDIGSSPVPNSPRLWTLTNRTIEGRFPNWRQVIPEEADCEFNLGLAFDPFLQGVPRLPRMKDGDEHDPVEITVKKNLLRIATVPGAYVEQPVLATFAPKIKDIKLRVARRFIMAGLHLGLRHWRLITDFGPITMADPDGRRKVVSMGLRAS